MQNFKRWELAEGPAEFVAGVCWGQKHHQEFGAGQGLGHPALPHALLFVPATV